MIRAPRDRFPLGRLPVHRLPDDALGYRVWSRPAKDGADTLLAYLAPGDLDYVVTGAPNSEQWVWVEAVSAVGVGQTGAAISRLRRVAFDALGNLILPVPNAPRAVAVAPAAAGAMTVTWDYWPVGEEVAPAAFKVYAATGATPIDYGTAAASVGGAARTASLAAYAHGTTVRVVVRAESADGDQEDNTTEASGVADALAPDPAEALVVEVTA